MYVVVLALICPGHALRHSWADIYRYIYDMRYVHSIDLYHVKSYLSSWEPTWFNLYKYYSLYVTLINIDIEIEIKVILAY